MSLVIVDYADLTVQNTSSELGEKIAEAYARGFGVIGIRNVPSFVECKAAVLRQAHALAHLPAEELVKLEDPKSLFNAGWSHGKEKLGDKPDFAKGSFYFNPLTDKPGTDEDREKFPAAFPCNIWPTERMPEFEPAAKRLGKVMHECVVHLSRHIDAHVQTKLKDYEPGLISKAMKTTEKAKGRLLYYFPMQKKGESSWIGWHNDSGFLTSLAGDMYVDDETGEEIECPDPTAGLYVVTRDGGEVKVDIPKECMAVQLGECIQIVTGGVLTATPHYVKGASSSATGIKVARISHPCFIDPNPDFQLNIPPSSDPQRALASNNKVPPLDGRFTTNGQVFGDFLQKTFQKYYEHNKQAGL